jgi:hypothetical protein
MLDVICKKEYFEWCDSGLVDLGRLDIKAAQDAWVLSCLASAKGLRIAEIGGGDSRVLAKLKANNECWNIDRLEGKHGGPARERIVMHQGVRYVDAYLGDFSPDLPANYFDVVFSISVIEHVPDERFQSFFRDMSRIMKANTKTYHAIDFYVGDEPRSEVDGKLDSLRVNSCGATGLIFDQAPAYPSPLTFNCSYVSNSDMAMALWNKMAPNLRAIRETCQAITLKAVWLKL